MTASQEFANEMNQPVFTEYDPTRPWVVLRKDYEEGSRAMWREYERFKAEVDARYALRNIRENQYAYEDRTGIEPMCSFKVVRQSTE
jgi:hypothetical protein